MNETGNTQKQVIEIKPKTTGWLLSYILFSLPGFIISSLALIILVIFLVGGIIGAMTEIDDNMLSYQTIQEGNSENRILVYNLSGSILTGDSSLDDSDRLNGIYTEIVERDFQKIKNDESIKAVVFRVNTPGGTIFASEVLGDQINDLIKAKGQEKAVYYYDSLAASGGLWASYKTPNYVIGNPYGQTGSIGVLITLPNFKGLADNIGYSETTIKSSDTKDIGNPFRDVTTSEREYFQDMVDESYNDFVEIVASGRNIERSKVLEFANGLIYDNDKAKEFGLIDETGDLEKAISKAAELEELSDYEVIEIETQIGFVDSIFGESYLAELIGLPKQAQTLNQRAEILKPGTIYAIDEFRI